MSEASSFKPTGIGFPYITAGIIYKSVKEIIGNKSRIEEQVHFSS